MTPEQRRARAYAAQAIVNEPVYKEAWDLIEQEMREEWERCILPRKRDRIWTELRHVRRLRQKLAGFAGQARE